MTRWESALDEQLSVIEFWRSPVGKRFGDGYSQSIRTKSADEFKLMQDVYRDMAYACEVMASNADPIYVDSDIMTIVEAAQETFQPEPLQPSDLITPCGFMVLPRPITLIDVHNKRVTYRAVGWYPTQVRHDRKGQQDAWVMGPTTSGVIMTLYHRADDVDDYTDGEMVGPRWLVAHITPWMYGSEPWTEWRDPADDRPTDEHGPTTDEHGPTAFQKPDVLPRWVQCIWRLMQQTVGVTHVYRSQAPRQFTRRWKRANLMAREVTVVTLRRPRTIVDHGKSSPVEWTHRWITSGHWRWQWYPRYVNGHDPDMSVVCQHRDANGHLCGMVGGIHRQVFIAPFVKGPADLPLVTSKTRVIAVVR
jgi:hypothetical protein